MIRRIIEYSVKHPFVIIFGVLLAVSGSIYSLKNIRLDAIPDLSDTQVILFVEWMGRSPDLVEDQITYPIVSKFSSLPKVNGVRGFSMFGMSFIYIIFEDGTDVYWARSRVNEYLSTISNSLPSDAKIQIGPDATSLGWVFQYVLYDKSGKNSIEDIRAFQEFYLKYALQSVKGVAEVASVGGFIKEYQIILMPDRLYAYGISVNEVADAIKRSNKEIGARIVEISQREYYVRGRGYIKSISDIEKVVIKNTDEVSPIRVEDIGRVSLVGDIRRGAADFNGEGEVVGGIVIARYGENALEVIDRVKAKIEEIKPSLPEGLEIKAVYDRSGLIERAIDTLKHSLIEEMIVVSIVIIIFLLHFRSSLVPIITLPIAVLLSFIPMYLFRIESNIMSLGGIAIAIGAMVDASIVLVENVHKRLEHITENQTRNEVILEALKEVGPSIFYSLLIITIAFLPIFALTGQSGRLFIPLAFTKTFAMFFAALLSVTLSPAIIGFLVRGRIFRESEHPVSKFLIGLYRPLMYVALKNPITTILIGVFAVLSAIPLFIKLGSEFMPPLYEGDLLYMPTTFPNISIEEAKRVLQIQDRVLREFQEVEAVFGKVGRAETPTDPAPLSMVETVIKLKPRSEWRDVEIKRFYSDIDSESIKNIFRFFLPDKKKITPEELISEMDRRLKFPGFTNAWTMPIKARIDMLSTGIRTPIGIKIFGDKLEDIEKTGEEIEKALSSIPSTRSVYSERNLTGLYLDIIPDRDKIQLYGLKIDDVLDYIELAYGGMTITTTVEGRERYPVNIRYPVSSRSDIDTLGEILIPIDIQGSAASTNLSTRNSDNTDMGGMNMGGSFNSAKDAKDSRSGYERGFIRLKDIAEIKVKTGPPMIKDENGLLVGYVYVDIDQSKTDIGSYVEKAKSIVREKIKLPPNTFLKWTGQYELMEVMYSRMKIVIPLTLLIIIILLYLNFQRISDVFNVLLVLPFSLVGSVWAMSIMGYNISVATIVGIIALLGLSAETGIVMLMYLHIVFNERENKGEINSKEDIVNAVLDGAVLRVRPKMMTVMTTFIGLVPLMWAQGSGADVMRRLALPMIGGLITSLFLTLEIIPVIFMYIKWFEFRKKDMKIE